MRNPAAGEVIEGTGGLRKMRFADARRGKGKRGRPQGDLLLVGQRDAILVVHAVRQRRDTRFDASTTQGAESDDQGRTGFKESGMKASAKGRSPRTAKRDLFAELHEGVTALAQARQGKRTLRTHAVEFETCARSDASGTRARPKAPQALTRVVRRLSTHKRADPREWEQGRAKPNAQAALLINLVKRYPDTVERLATI